MRVFYMIRSAKLTDDGLTIISAKTMVGLEMVYVILLLVRLSYARKSSVFNRGQKARKSLFVRVAT